MCFSCHLYSGTLLVTLTFNVPCRRSWRSWWRRNMPGSTARLRKRSPVKAKELQPRPLQLQQSHNPKQRSDWGELLVLIVPQCERRFRIWVLWFGSGALLGLRTSLCFILLSIWAICTLLTLLCAYVILLCAVLTAVQFTVYNYRIQIQIYVYFNHMFADVWKAVHTFPTLQGCEAMSFISTGLNWEYHLDWRWLSCFTCQVFLRLNPLKVS